MRVRRGLLFLLVLSIVGTLTLDSQAEDKVLHSFVRKPLTKTYFSEGANGGDLNKDGHVDVIYGPYWFEGPAFEVKHELYPAKPQNVEGYADNFFNWVYDFNGDGWNDVFVVGFPGTPAYVYENPEREGFDKPWPKHVVFESVGNESPHFINLTGDDRPELVCTLKGGFGYASINWDKPFETWAFHKFSDEKGAERFGHGLGVGDVNGDKLNDVLVVNGWFEQPKENPATSRWEFHPVAFSNAYGGAEMYAYDVDGDGDNDVITSLAAHDFGLAWYEQQHAGTEVTFTPHVIMGNKPSKNRYGLVFSELHSVALADMDGDGLKDIITGKTYYSHHKQSPMWDAGAVVYWFKLARTAQGVDWIPYKADGEAGIGRQVSIVDVDGDKLPDIVVGGMLGAHVLFHKTRKVTDAEWEAAQPKVVEIAEAPTTGPKGKFSEATGRVEGSQEGEALKIVSVSDGRTVVQNMQGFKADKWSDGKQLFWTGAKPGAKLALNFEAEASKTFDVLAAFTMAQDYAIVKISLDGKTLRDDLDLFNSPEVISSGEVKLGQVELDAGRHVLTIEVTGANPAAARQYMVGLDYLRLDPK